MSNPKEKEIPFGANFEVDESNRLDVLRGEEKMADYVEFARGDVRGALKLESGERWPEMPRGVPSVEALFGEVHQTVNARWRKKAIPVLMGQCKAWLEKIPNTEGFKEVRSLLSDPERLEDKMESRQIGALESLREALPEAWRSLILASSERQMAEVELSRHWANEISEKDEKEWGMSKSELELFAEIPGFLGKYIDQGYLKQLELADRPGGSSASPLAGKIGADRLYDIQRKGSKKVEKLPYIAVFPFELGRFSKLLRHLKGKVESRLAQGGLPQSYAGLPGYLGKMAEVYSSREVSPKKIAKLNSELAEEANRLVQGGCPLVLIPQATAAVSGDAEKVDVELRMGLRPKQVKETERQYEGMRRVAQEMAAEFPEAVKEEALLPMVTLAFQPFAFGPNLHWLTRAENTKEKVLSHPNVVTDVAIRKEIPLLKKMFGLEGMDPTAYGEAANLETVLHELAHGVLSREDESVRKRVGAGNLSTSVEELKADTVSALILSRGMEGAGAKIELKTQFLAKVGTVLDYLHGSSEQVDDPYFFTGLKIIHALLQAKIIEKAEGGKYGLRNPEEGFRVIGAIGNEILGNYANLKTKPQSIKKYADQVLALKKDPMMKEFLGRLNANGQA